MEEETETTPLPQRIRDVPATAETAAARAVGPVRAKECDEIGSWRDIHLGPSRGPSRPRSAIEEGELTVEGTIDGLLEEIRDCNGRHDGEEDQHLQDGGCDGAAASGDEATEGGLIHGDDVGESDAHGLDGNDDDTAHADEHFDEADSESRKDGMEAQEELDEVSVHTGEVLQDGTRPPVEDEEHTAHDAGAEDNDEHHDETPLHGEASFQEDPSTHEESAVHDDQSSVADVPDSESEHDVADDDDQHEVASILAETEEGAASRRSSTLSDRRSSLRTEALIQAAARAVVVQIEERAIAAVQSHRNSLSASQVQDGDTSLVSTASHDERVHDPADVSDLHHSPARRRQSSNSSGSQVHHHQQLSSSDEAGDSSSHHEAEDDVFSDRGGSARSSLGSEPDEPAKTPVRRDNSNRASPRLSGVSSLSQYERDESFAPARSSRDTPPPHRMPFRTPSDVRALQMSSPTPSVFNGASPRSARRSGLPPGSPGGGGASAQYSPKGRSTPPRFKMKKEAPPLVLLHVTLLPLRWMRGEAVEGLDGAAGVGGFEPSDELKALRDAWRQLQDRVGDTVLERGILLPHPQNDYEVLEERLLEALELPLRRRARILECGHYLGPANEMADEEEEEERESEHEYGVQAARFRRADRRHWCCTCKGEIKYEDLGPGRVFRVKVYASNGLMKAGAWAACWKEMERVDVEVEPIVDTALHRELERLAAFQVEQEEHRQRELEEEERARHEAELGRDEEASLPPVSQARMPYAEHHAHPDIFSSPSPAMHASPPTPLQSTSSPLPQEPIDTSEARRRREEARLREIYGSSPRPASRFDAVNDATPSSMRPEPPTTTSAFPPEAVHRQTHPSPNTAHATTSYNTPPPSPRSPSEEAAERRSRRRAGAYQGASLPELVLEAAKVVMRDRKNVAIAVLGLFVVLLAMRPGGQRDVGPYRVGVPVVPVMEAESAMSTGVKGKEGYGLETAVAATAVVNDGPLSSLETVIADMASAGEPAGRSIELCSEPVTVTVADVRSGVDVSSDSDGRFATGVSSSSPSSPPEERVTQKKVVRVVETVTETVKVSVTATHSVVGVQETEYAAETKAQPDVAVETAVDTGADRLTPSTALGLPFCPLEESEVCYVGGDIMVTV